jgi:hypothetical protein
MKTAVSCCRGQEKKATEYLSFQHYYGSEGRTNGNKSIFNVIESGGVFKY